MAQTTKTVPKRTTRPPTRNMHNTNRTFMPATVVIAFSRIRQVWSLLFLTCIGMIAAVLLACTIPLYTNVAMTAGVRSVLGNSSQNSDIVVRSLSGHITSSILQSVTQELNSKFQRNFGSILTAPQFSIETQYFPVTALTKSNNQGNAIHPGGNQLNMSLISASMDKVATHVKLLRGRLPSNISASDTIETALPLATATFLHADVGSIIRLNIAFIDANTDKVSRSLSLHVVGIFNLASTDDVFWHGDDFQYYQPSDFITNFNGLVATTPLMSTLDRLCNDPALRYYVLNLPTNVIWYYHLNLPQVRIENLDTITQGISTIKTDNSNNSDLEQSPFIEQTQTYVPSDAIDQYSQRIQVAQLPVTSLLWLILGLLLFFVSTMADLLVERQADAIAILRSRGASRSQVFGALVTQGIGVALVALIVGTALALPTTRWLVQRTLPAADQGALNILDSAPLSILWSIRLYAFLAVNVALLAMIGTVVRSMGLDVLAVRREATRSTRRSLWQRWNVDIVAALIALTSFAILTYITKADILDPYTALILLTPLTLLSSVFLLIAVVLLLLRFFPVLLRGSASVLGRGRSATPLLALAQMARSSRQPLRITLLLTLALSFAIFSLVCLASQSQRVLDVTAFQAGADFSGTASNNLFTASQLPAVTTAYSSIPGVRSASLGYTTSAIAGNGLSGASIDFHAVDANTFAQTAIWNAQDSEQALTTLMHLLKSQRPMVTLRHIVPAIVDTQALDTLHIGMGGKFTLNFSSLSHATDLTNFVVVAVVQHIPTPNTSIGPGVLVDYESYATNYEQKEGISGNLAIPIDTIWLRTADDPVSLQSVRHALNNGELQLDSVYDRRALIDTQYHEPLYLTLVGVLGLGATTALLLALVGSLTASWASIRGRLSSFTILRALGATPIQVVFALTWEQCFIYVTAILLGIVFGLVFSFLVVPVLTFTSISPLGVSSDISTQAFYMAQSTPPLRIIIPATVGIALVLLAVLCLVTLALMVWLVLRPAISTMLRINED